MADFFSHDYHARHDPKVQSLLMKHGLAGLGLYWAIVEYCYEQNGVITEMQCECIAYDMRTQCDTVKSVLNDFELFVKGEKGWYSESINKRLKIRSEKASKAALSAEKRWGYANALRSHTTLECDRNAIKDIKGKDIKRKDIKEKFIPPPFEELKKYCIENGYGCVAEKAFRYYEVAGWKDSGGSQVRNWKQKLIAVWFKPENKDKPKQPVFYGE